MQAQKAGGVDPEYETKTLETNTPKIWSSISDHKTWEAEQWLKRQLICWRYRSHPWLEVLTAFPSLGMTASQFLPRHRNSKCTFRQRETTKQKPTRKLGQFPTWAITVPSVLLGGGVTQASALQRGRYCMGDSHLVLLFAPLQQDLCFLHLPFFGPLSPLTQKKGL